MRNLVTHFAEDDQREGCNKDPLNNAKQALASRVNISSSCIQIRHELAVGACGQVPSQINRYQENDGLYVYGILKRICHHATKAYMFGGVLLVCKFQAINATTNKTMNRMRVASMPSKGP